MLLLPTGHAVHENLNSSFTQFDALIQELKNNEFTGYLRVSDAERDGFLLLRAGSLIAGMEQVGEARRGGPAAIESLFARARQRDQALGLYSLSPEWVRALADMTATAAVHKNLSSEFTDLAGLFVRLQNDKHAGHVELALNNHAGAAVVFFRDGEPVECLFSSPAEALAGLAALPRIIAAVSEFGAAISVFRTDAEQALANGPAVVSSWELPQLLLVWQKIIRIMERTADGLAGRGTFSAAFQRVLADRVDEYPFLDPFGSCVYRDGQLSYRGSWQGPFSCALGICLTATLDQVAEGTTVNLRTRVKLALQPVRQQDAEAIARFGLQDALDWDLSLYERVLAEAGPLLGDAAEKLLERQCREHLRIAPSALTVQHLPELARWVEVSTSLILSEDKARALRQKIADLGTQS